eukprot:Gb_29615 [translate_table: standard]
MDAAQDGLSSLPDSILCSILSKMPLRNAVGCSILSRRWRFLYTQMPRLSFSPVDISGNKCQLVSTARAEDIISSVLLVHSGNLEALHLCTDLSSMLLPWRFNWEKVCHWVRYAALHNVKSVSLHFPEARKVLPSSLFSCDCLTTLSISNYILTHVPSDFCGFTRLTVSVLRSVKLTDTSLDNFISHCPHLQTLDICCCQGLCNPKISAPNLLNLTVKCSLSGDVLTVNCPKLLKICLDTDSKKLKFDRVLLHEFSYTLNTAVMLPDGDLTELELYCEEEQAGRAKFYADRFVEIVGRFNTLQLLLIDIEAEFERGKEADVRLLSLLDRLPNLRVLYLFGDFIQELLRDPELPFLSSPHANLKHITAQVNGFDGKAIPLLGCLLNSTPTLQTMTIGLPKGYDDKECIRFLKLLLGLNRASANAVIKLN